MCPISCLSLFRSRSARSLSPSPASSSAIAGPAKTASKHAPIQLLRDRDGNPVADVTGALESPNWSGYILAKFQTGQKYKAITATWTVPDVVFQGVDASSAEWVGIGGFCKNAKCNKQKDVDKTLIQLGTAQEAFGTSDLQYFAWYEMLPLCSHHDPARSEPRRRHHRIADLRGKCKGNASWTLSFTNETTSDTFSKTVKYKSPNLSAEWIEEAPVSGDGVVPLADYDTATFSNGTVNGDTADLSNADQRRDAESQRADRECVRSQPVTGRLQRMLRRGQPHAMLRRRPLTGGPHAEKINSLAYWACS